ncbi:MAG: DUF4326 domain-containing protein [Melioribacteraceae bacterium]|nr:DUF4326 domain-containing protein [Melioribacteraceae bacterium]
MIGTIEVVNKYTYEGDYIDIMRGTPLGNPYIVSDSMSREQSVLNFYKYFRKEFFKKTDVYNAIMEIVEKVKSGENVKIKCCCKPKLCHGDIIKIAIESILEKQIRNNT